MRVNDSLVQLESVSGLATVCFGRSDRIRTECGVTPVERRIWLCSVFTGGVTVSRTVTHTAARLASSSRIVPSGRSVQLRNAPCRTARLASSSRIVPSGRSVQLRNAPCRSVEEIQKRLRSERDVRDVSTFLTDRQEEQPMQAVRSEVITEISQGCFNTVRKGKVVHP
ncbi:hypothetical protein DPX16_2726 [Anabarilius grahami]|uniref:Uncharacterized protein n=1 Tax=Anabarilius grahami TaxID=495550 RepID=A0A3N0XGN0_ANAGA|nr:hypothetical protein DPX16_2726 [Anabarilius grahami]